MAKAEEAKWVPPPKIEDLYAKTAGNNFSGVNAPTAGPRNDTALKVGDGEGEPAALQLYSLATPNGWKVGILLEELGVPYDAHVVNIGRGEQFTAGFVGANPNSKIPALIDHDGPGHEPLAIMEGGAILVYLAEKFPGHGFLPADPRLRAECLQWAFWQVGGQGPMTGNFGHFMVYAPPDAAGARDYGVARYGMEVQRLTDVLERHLAGYGDFKGSAALRKEGPRKYLVGDTFTIADMACFPWVQTVRGRGYNRPGQPDAKDFLSFDRYKNVIAWADRILERPAVYRGMRVCAGSPKPWLQEAAAKL